MQPDLAQQVRKNSDVYREDYPRRSRLRVQPDSAQQVRRSRLKGAAGPSTNAQKSEAYRKDFAQEPPKGAADPVQQKQKRHQDQL